MNRYAVVGDLELRLREALGRIRQARFFRDRLSAALLVVALAVNAVNLVTLLLRVRPSSVAVPTRYSNLGGGFDLLGPWYFPFEIAVLALVLSLANGWLAYHGFGRSRLASFFLLTGSGVVAFFSFIISMAFGVIR